MAAGCVPVVPRNKARGLIYWNAEKANLNEAAKKIRMLLENEDLRAEASARAAKRAMAFDSSVFERKILRIVERIYCSKRTW